MAGLSTHGGWKGVKQKLLPRTLYGRSLMIIVVPILLIQVIVAYIFINRHWERMSDALAFALAGEIAVISDELSHAKTPAEIGRIAQRAAAALDMTLTVEERKVASLPAARAASLSWYGVEDKLQKYLAQKLSGPFSVAFYPEDRRFEVSVQVDGRRAARYLVYNRRLVSPTTYIFLLWLVGSSVVLMAIAVLFMRNQIRPIRRLAIAAEKLGKGQDVADFKPEGAREVRQAARSFLEMRDRIRRQIEQRTAMLAGVSHDLRTPLTRMKLQLALMKQTAENGNLRQDLEEMERMLEGYLTFARGEGDEETETVDLRSLLERVVGNARRQGHAVEAGYAGALTLRARPVALERAVANIVSNACKFARHVWVSAREDAETEAIEILVDDDGPGIPPQLRDEVFKPFYRLEKSRNPKTGGVGLGLSIVQDIVHGHGGEIALQDSPRGGLRVLMRLPL